jgi:hypothetical protein
MDHRTHPVDFTSEGKVIPDRTDIEAIDRRYGDTKSAAERYQFAQARKFIRLFGPKL